MGRVFLAIQQAPRRHVAVKALTPALAGDPRLVAVLGHEANALGSISSPRIAQIYEFVADGDPPFLAMEFVDGLTLAQVLGPREAGGRKPLAVERAIRVVRSLAEGLRDLHRNLQPIIHLDLKPSNVMLASDDSVKILDLGFARLRERRVVAAMLGESPFTGLVVGCTREYASPEQLASLDDETIDLDARCDTWALGAILFECLTGRLPFGDGEGSEYAAQVRGGSVRWPLLPTVPRWLNAVLRATLRHDASHRLEDGEAVLRMFRVGEDRPLEIAPRHAPSNLRPLPRDDPFVGRDAAVRTVTTRLRTDGGAVVLHGASGVGKSRLALECARLLAMEGPELWSAVVWIDVAQHATDGGVAAVEVGEVEEGAVGGIELDASIAAALRAVHEASGATGSAERSLASILRRGPALLVLDGADGRAAAVAELCRQLRAQHPNLSLLITSIDPGAFPPEWCVRVECLASPRRLAQPARVVESPAVALFAAAARRVDPAFELTAANAQDVAEICRRVGGLPLAIRVVAAQMRTLLPAEALARWPSVERSGRDGTDDRQRTIEDAIDFTIRLLREPERVLLARLSIFDGGCTLAACEAICADERDDPTPFEDEGIPEACVGGSPIWSVLQRLETLGLAESRRKRFSLHAFVRGRAHRLLREDRGAARVAAEFKDFFLRLVASSVHGRSPQGWEMSSWATAIDGERVNIGRLWKICAAQSVGRDEDLALIVRGMFLYWWDRSDAREAWPWVTEALKGRQTLGLRDRASLLNAAANVGLQCERFAEADSLWTEAEAIATELQDRWLQTVFAAGRTLAAFRIDDAAAALSHAERTLELAASAGLDGLSEAVLQAMLAKSAALLRLSRWDEARVLLGSLIPQLEAAGDARRLYDALVNLSQIALAQRRPTEAREVLLRTRHALKVVGHIPRERARVVFLHGVLWTLEGRRLGCLAKRIGLAALDRAGGYGHRLQDELASLEP